MNGVRHLVEVTPDLLQRNDDAPAPGRLLVRCGCAICRRVDRFALGGGRWAVQHIHGDGWTARPLSAGEPQTRQLVSA